MRFTTASGSTYEMDTDTKHIRRLNGKTDITPRTGEDGKYKPYESVSSDLLGRALAIGKPAIIIWVQKETTPLDPELPNGLKTTITTNVVSIEE